MIEQRNQFPQLLKSLGLTRLWVELGVARGDYSRELALQRPAGCSQVAIDAWAGDRGHDAAEYDRARSVLSPLGVVVLQARFENAVGMFADGSFDFVYIDGYAHTGQNNGQTLDQWWPKIAKGGIMAGHDYCSAWPHTVTAVDEFAAKMGLEVTVVAGDQYPSWYVIC